MSPPLFRTAIAGAVLLLGAPLSALATDPASGTISLDNPRVEFTSGPHFVSNPSATAELVCADPAVPCDDFALSISLPADILSEYPNALVVSRTSWDDVTEDYDIYLLNSEGQSAGSAASSDNPEIIPFAPSGGEQEYTIRVVPFLVTGTTATTIVTLELGDVAQSGSDGNDGGTVTPPDYVAEGIGPRYDVYVSPPEEGNDAGEPTVGYNPLSKNAMFISYTNALRVTFPENLETPLPTSCDARWLNKSGTITQLNTLDPIMTTDQTTGRTFNSQLAGANSLFEFSDDDGESWTPGQIGIPNGGADHQGVVAGPYPANFPLGGLLYPNAVYYCSQSVAAAFCSRSDDGGQTFGPGFPFKNTDCAAGGLHGHPKVAPDGTLYIPDSSQCVLPLGESAEKVVTFVSEDAGLTYEARPIPQSDGGAGSDPSIGLATDGTAYMCYENADGTTHVAVSGDKGLTWENDKDIGAEAGLVATRFPAMIAGDPDRAACFFLGTKTRGPDLDLAFQGVWYPYIATTYDRGETWHLLNLTPNDPVQGFGGVGTSGTNRNLLDFNDLELDEYGRPLVAWADGCIGGCAKDPSQNSFAAKAMMARLSGGKTLYAEFDGMSRFTDQTTTPAASCPMSDLSVRNAATTVVGWNPGDNGGSAVTSYEVYRATAADGAYTLVGTTSGKTQFEDPTADPNVGSYYYKVVGRNAQGSSEFSNALELPFSAEAPVNTCVVPGETVFLDSAGDAPVPDFDILSLSVAEPPEFEGFFVITEKVAGFEAGTPLATSFYPVMFPLLNGFYFAMDVGQGTPRFVYGSTSELPQGLLAFNEEGELDDRSTVDADGTITFVVPKALFGELSVGQILAGFDARTRLGAASAPSRDTAGPGDYEVRGTASCGAAATGVILAKISGTPDEGSAPLTVTYSIGGTPSEGAELTRFSIDFGDGQTMPDQSFDANGGARVTHVYQEAGVYRARLTVRDSSGAQSSNLAEHTVNVLAGSTTGGGDTVGSTRGGALGGMLLIALGLLGLRRRV